jgi:hypothetical protein
MWRSRCSEVLQCRRDWQSLANSTVIVVLLCSKGFDQLFLYSKGFEVLGASGFRKGMSLCYEIFPHAWVDPTVRISVIINIFSCYEA